MANVTSELKKFFSCEGLKGEFFNLGAKNYFLKLKKGIDNFLVSNKKMQAKKKEAERALNSDTYNNLKNFADILNNSDVDKICKTAKLLPRFVLNTNGDKNGKISSIASIKKVSKDIEKWEKTLKSILSEIKSYLDYLGNIQVELENYNKYGGIKMKEEKWEKISSRFKKSEIKELEEIACQIDKNIINTMQYKVKLYVNWYENKTIKNLIDKLINLNKL